VDQSHHAIPGVFLPGGLGFLLGPRELLRAAVGLDDLGRRPGAQLAV